MAAQSFDALMVRHKQWRGQVGVDGGERMAVECDGYGFQRGIGGLREQAAEQMTVAEVQSVEDSYGGYSWHLACRVNQMYPARESSW